MPKSDKAAAEGLFFRQQLGQLDWSELKPPPALIGAGVAGGRGRRVHEASRGTAAPDSSGSLQMGTSGTEEGRSRGSGEGWGWEEGVLVGVAGGVLASACVVVLGGAIKRGMRGDRGYEDISGSPNAW